VVFACWREVRSSSIERPLARPRFLRLTQYTAPKPARRTLYGGLALLIVATVMLAAGNR
jgi:hypothetical protein